MCIGVHTLAEAEDLRNFRHYKTRLDMPSPIRRFSSKSTPRLLFSDGSGWFVTSTEFRLMAFAVWDAHEELLFHSSPVNGIVQTVPRAEALGVLFSVLSTEFAQIYCDCQYAVDMANDILDLKVFIWTSIDHGDVWYAFFQAVHNIEGNYRVHKVKAHTSEEDDTTDFDAWARVHNNHADHFANEAQKNRPSDFIAMRKKLFDAEIHRCEVIKALQLHAVAISQIYQAALKDSTAREKVEEGSHVWIPIPRIFAPQDQLQLKQWVYDGDSRLALQLWLKQIKFSNSGEVTSWLELYVDFALATGRVAPINSTKKHHIIHGQKKQGRDFRWTKQQRAPDRRH